MEISIRPMTQAERTYGYTWGKYVMAQSGCIGHLRGDMGSSGQGFYTSWDDHNLDMLQRRSRYGPHHINM